MAETAPTVMATTEAALEAFAQAVRRADRAFGRAALRNATPGMATDYVREYLLPAMTAAGLILTLKPGVPTDAR